MQVDVHVPFTQVVPASQTLPQAPQLKSVVMSVSQPGWFGSQSAKPALQVPWPQVPLTQIGVLFTPWQTFPQAPQFWGSVRRLAPLHVLVQRPSLQVPPEAPPQEVPLGAFWRTQAPLLQT